MYSFIDSLKNFCFFLRVVGQPWKITPQHPSFSSIEGEESWFGIEVQYYSNPIQLTWTIELEN